MSTRDKKLKILVLGDSGVGKTALIRQFSEKKFFPQSIATLGVDYSNRDVYINKKNVAVRIWDTAGQERFRSLGAAFYRGSEGCALVFDVTSLKTFTCLRYWLNMYLEENPTMPGKQVPIVVVGNKTDLDKNLRVVSSHVAKKWCQQNGYLPYFELSAKDFKKTEELFMSVISVALHNRESSPRFPNPLRFIHPPPDTYDCNCSSL
ncbi:hypothetical protein DSO57_1014486 [Entomophthora muscae]|uniref:Uncharacterized protein n=1 Tax=Entomophthora muscae TaxID=34485 RepID=A0ACC2TSU0_9FUNG|nr:hypothetical protein DSO57_1014486 [Entomophthora muscae]